ncbi:MAG: hypothetical protein ACXABI_16785 [Candidatus Hodarchaeales archaeon]|jgi:Ni,Fe-hydrogenase III large subunit
MQRSGKTAKALLDSYRVKPPSFDPLVKSILLQNFKDYQRKPDQIQTKFKNEPYSKLITFLEQDQPLTSFSRQILVSETLERITGTVISPDMQKYRGILLSFEKTVIILRFFQRLGTIMNNTKLSSISKNGYETIQSLFEKLWGENPTKNVIRPGSVIKPIDNEEFRLINSKIHLTQKISKRIRKIIEKSKELKDTINEVTFLDELELRKYGINGPIARSYNVIHPDRNPISEIPLNSSHFLTQSVYSVHPDPINIIFIYIFELVLALGRIQFLLPKIKNLSSVNTPRPLNGYFAFTMPVLLGLNHLSLEMEDYRIKYVNFIPFEVNNALGISRLIRKNEIQKTLFILSFLHPEITLE